MRNTTPLRLSCAISLSWLLAVARVGAQPPPPGPPAPAAGEPAQQAAQLSERAKALFLEGAYRAALPLMQRAYALSPEPRFLFNLGVLHHKLSQCVPARDFFELYLQRQPAGAARAEAVAALQELQERCPAQDGERAAAEPAPGSLREQPGGELAPEPPLPAPALPAPAPALPPRAPASVPAPPPVSAGLTRDARWAPSASAVLLMGLGSAAGMGALATLGAQRSAQHDIDALGERARRQQLSWDEVEGQRRALGSDARLYRGLSLGLAAASVALVGVGATMWIVEVTEASAGVETVSLTYRARF